MNFMLLKLRYHLGKAEEGEGKKTHSNSASFIAAVWDMNRYVACAWGCTNDAILIKVKSNSVFVCV